MSTAPATNMHGIQDNDHVHGLDAPAWLPPHDRWSAYSRMVSMNMRQAHEIDRLHAELAAVKGGKRAPSKAIEWSAALLGVIGALLLATNFHPAWGFAWFLASNAGWIVFALQGRCFGMLAQQVLFTGTSLVGLWNWWLGPIVLKSGLWAGVLTQPLFWLAALAYLARAYAAWKIVRVNHGESESAEWAEK